jgi:hypothetical protein
MNESTIQKLRELDAKAVKGPWQRESEGSWNITITQTDEADNTPEIIGAVLADPFTSAQREVTAELIITLRNEALPLIESQQKRIEELEETLTWVLYGYALNADRSHSDLTAKVRAALTKEGKQP